jgi:hypothetical protein
MTNAREKANILRQEQLRIEVMSFNSRCIVGMLLCLSSPLIYSREISPANKYQAEQYRREQEERDTDLHGWLRRKHMERQV